MQRFYIPYVIDNPCKLGPEESWHCIKVLRLKAGDHIELTDGHGSLFKAEIEDASPKACVLKILEQHKEPPSTWELHVAIAPTKNLARMEWLIEKLTEIGITEFIPFVSHHSERKVLKTDRLKKITIEAMKQSGRTFLPFTREIVSYTEMLKSTKDFAGQKFILHCIDKDLNTFSQSYTKGQNALILIGPEGDFTNMEAQEAIGHGFVPITLGNVRYRTETAALVAACTLHAMNA
ncbi:MAG TPA: 16S rRNA (uracil(1498)-N(3))-methyltransferase [Bacteroidia bacterium]|nr:16S rRNA (uracil(1498)-N(3))-methyltransferase [Bacteroidia bacterium]